MSLILALIGRCESIGGGSYDIPKKRILLLKGKEQEISQARNNLTSVSIFK